MLQTFCNIHYLDDKYFLSSHPPPPIIQVMVKKRSIFSSKSLPQTTFKGWAGVRPKGVRMECPPFEHSSFGGAVNGILWAEWGWNFSGSTMPLLWVPRTFEHLAESLTSKIDWEEMLLLWKCAIINVIRSCRK